MIITRTPFRISFVGGGTDIKNYYRSGYGAVLSATINKYMYITVNKRFDNSIRLSYSKTEIVDNINDIQHDIVREAMKLTGIEKGIEITSISDIPAGTGLGSSSSFTVGLLNALYTYRGQQLSAYDLAKKACEIEIEILGKPIGKQDQFAAAYGGINYYRFNSDESVNCIPIELSDEDIYVLNNRLSMWYTGITRSADEILIQQKKEASLKIDTLDFMRGQADALRQSFSVKGLTDDFGTIIHEGWMKKKTITNSISNGQIDKLYTVAQAHGAIGGKLLGAGGGGFILLYSSPGCHDTLRDAIGLKELHFSLTNHGSRIVFMSEE